MLRRNPFAENSQHKVRNRQSMARGNAARFGCLAGGSAVRQFQDDEVLGAGEGVDNLNAQPGHPGAIPRGA